VPPFEFSAESTRSFDHVEQVLRRDHTYSLDIANEAKLQLVLTDLMHWADHHGISFHTIVTRAGEQYRKEK
jgi:hypothetical protein